MKNKKIFFIIYISFIIIAIASMIILSILGKKERIGYLSDFKINVDKTFILNNFSNIEEIKESFRINNELDYNAVSSYILTNESIVQYSYDFRISYYNKVFRNSDIYGVYIDTNKIMTENNFIKEMKMEGNGSPFGNFVSDKIIDFEKIDNVSYKLLLKDYVIILIIFIYIIYTFLLYINKILFENNKYKLLFYIITFIFSISSIYVLQINILYIIDLLIFVLEMVGHRLF